VSPDSARQRNLWKQQLGRVPGWVYERTDLETLVLADNGPTEVSDRSDWLAKLHMLDLGHNRLTCVPASLGNLAELTDFVYQHDNRLSPLPCPLARLTRLRYLNIGDNAFTTLPDVVRALEALVELRADGNQLACLPQGIGWERALTGCWPWRRASAASRRATRAALRGVGRRSVRGDRGAPVIDARPVAGAALWRRARELMAHPNI
jgi:Leucine-rich repeat (LRR) protein